MGSENADVLIGMNQLRTQYDVLIEKFEYNNLVYNAKFTFEPIVGKVYHLYRNRKEEPFLSIIAPSECSFDHLGTFRLNADKM
ncbi:DUF2452 domain-containing protein [uncultured Aquimarina sp.]|uniref:DUF2452 domain-containing protein n=1 Tax=uncultured Aquimarina sp. TaxID=575652 RepID=UPI0026192182|nr:DUF2452 domain-containing protein [uncultured Aquimarina sp.]